MATEIIYRIEQSGLYLGWNGELVLDSDNTWIKFDSLDQIKTFVEVSGSIGTYNIEILAKKS
jgi:hypothetical protein